MKLNQPVPEIPVADVQKAQEYYTRIFGCKTEWFYPDGEIGSVSNGETALFFRKRKPPFEPAVNWIYCEDVDETYRHLKNAGASITDDIEDKPWGIRQFSVEDLDGNIFYFHHG